MHLALKNIFPMPLKIGLGWKIILSFREDYFFAFQVAQAIGVVFGFVDVG
jgi:hypothetical protein